MDTLSYKTISANKATVTKEWVVVDATGLPMGRLSSQIAMMLRGKNKPNFTPHVDCGDNVIVINAEKATLSGAKMTEREYTHFSGYPGGLRKFSPKEVIEKRGYPELFRRTVRGMLPKNRLGDKLINNLYVYEGPEHKHEAQQPRKVEVTFKQK